MNNPTHFIFTKPLQLLIIIILLLIFGGCSNDSNLDLLYKKKNHYHEAFHEYYNCIDDILKKNKIAKDEINDVIIESHRMGFNLKLIPYLENELDKNPGNYDFHSLLAKIIHDQGSYEEASTYLSKLTDIENNHIILSRLLEMKLDRVDETWVTQFVDSISEKDYQNYNYNLSKVFEIRGDFDKALKANYNNVDNAKNGNYLRSKYAKNISTIHKELNNGLLRDYFYFLYHHSIKYKTYDRLKKYHNEYDDYKLISSQLSIKVLSKDNVNIRQNFEINFNKRCNSIKLPISLSTGNEIEFETRINPEKKFKIKHERHQKNEILSIKFNDTIQESETINIKVSYKSALRNNSTDWSNFDFKVFHPVSKINLQLSNDLIFNKKFSKFYSHIKIHKINAHKYEFQIEDPNVIELIRFNFTKSDTISWVSNKILFLSTFCIIIAFLMVLIITFYGTAKGAKIGLIVLSIAYIIPILSITLTENWHLDLSEKVFGEIFSYKQGFSQKFLALILLSINTLLLTFSYWFIRDFKSRLRENIGRVYIEFYLLTVPIIIPIILSTGFSFLSLKYLHNNHDWYFNSYIVVFYVLLSTIVIIIMLRQTNQSLISLFTGSFIGILAMFLANTYPFLKIIFLVVFSSLVLLILYGLWIKYKSEWKNVKIEESNKKTILSRLEKDIKYILDKYSYVIKVATLISGLAAFSVVMMNLVK
ncbi:tetratricopeptide repeat protein [Flavivirga spongiicola]|uniref:Uncharacterized protein n=1 Tax=Flavivirga spongiicola TaxID=421621 RepID=A0ABU7XVH6_9FLAO|nr:hypothetical protein [Flavivirga sp. MEBiC05379]MDO5978930.1 hypothetical protein [Flavivirga sp. MEBiC05379]